MFSLHAWCLKNGDPHFMFCLFLLGFSSLGMSQNEGPKRKKRNKKQGSPLFGHPVCHICKKTLALAKICREGPDFKKETVTFDLETWFRQIKFI